MKKLFIKIYDLVTAPLYRRLSRDFTLQLQEISKAYIDQHERLTAKMVEEFVKLSMRVDSIEDGTASRQQLADAIGSEVAGKTSLSSEEIWSLLTSVHGSVDLVEFCSNHGIALTTFLDLQSKYHGIDPSVTRKIKTLEASNLELQRLTTMLISEVVHDRHRPATIAAAEPGAAAKSNANGRD